MTRRLDVLIHEAPLRELPCYWWLSALKASFRLPVARTGFLAVVTSSGSSSITWALPSSYTFLLFQKKSNDRNKWEWIDGMLTECCDFGAGVRLARLTRTELVRMRVDMVFSSNSSNSGVVSWNPNMVIVAFVGHRDKPWQRDWTRFNLTLFRLRSLIVRTALVYSGTFTEPSGWPICRRQNISTKGHQQGHRSLLQVSSLSDWPRTVPWIISLIFVHNNF